MFHTSFSLIVYRIGSQTISTTPRYVSDIFCPGCPQDTYVWELGHMLKYSLSRKAYISGTRLISENTNNPLIYHHHIIDFFTSIAIDRKDARDFHNNCRIFTRIYFITYNSTHLQPQLVVERKHLYVQSQISEFVIN